MRIENERARVKKIIISQNNGIDDKPRDNPVAPNQLLQVMTFWQPSAVFSTAGLSHCEGLIDICALESA